MTTNLGKREWLVAAVVAGLLGWWAAPLPDAGPGLVKARQDAWRLAPLPRRGDQTALAAGVIGANYWGASALAAAALAAAPIEDPRWRIAAIYGAGNERGALLLFAAPKKEAQRVRVGDTLPSGHRIVSIGDNEVCVLIGKKTYRLGVERSGS